MVAALFTTKCKAWIGGSVSGEAVQILREKKIIKSVTDLAQYLHTYFTYFTKLS